LRSGGQLEVEMRSTDHFHPEWGYLAPAPSFLRTLRIVLVATAVGATAGAAVVLSLVDHPAAESDNTTVAARTMVVRGNASVATAVQLQEQPQSRTPVLSTPILVDSSRGSDVPRREANMISTGPQSSAALVPAAATEEPPAQAPEAKDTKLTNIAGQQAAQRARVQAARKATKHARTVMRPRQEYAARFGYTSETSPNYRSW